MRIGISEARRRLPELMRAARDGNISTIEVSGRPMAALVPLDVVELVNRATRGLVSMREIEQAVVLASVVPEVAKIVLFGSYARGDAREASDVDLLVVIDAVTNPEGGGLFWDVYMQVEEALRRSRRAIRFEVVPVTVVEWEANTGVVASARLEGKLLYDRC